MYYVGRQNEGSFGFAKRWLLCRAKTNVPECAVGFLFLSLCSKNSFVIQSLVSVLFTMNGNVCVNKLFGLFFYYKIGLLP